MLEGVGFYFWLGAAADAATGSREPDPIFVGSGPAGFDPARFMEVVERHAATVTLSFLCDIAPVLGLRLRVSLEDAE